MYKVEVKSSGMYDHVTLGTRYFLFRKDALRFAGALKEEKCEFEITKFVRMYFGAYCWSDDLD